jgi:hypothetical protein
LLFPAKRISMSIFFALFGFTVGLYERLFLLDLLLLHLLLLSQLLYSIEPNVVVEWLALLLHAREAPSSNFDPETG